MPPPIAASTGSAALVLSSASNAFIAVIRSVCSKIMMPDNIIAPSYNVMMINVKFVHDIVFV